ncbi:Lateral organ boundaries, LOB, partial [Dillenia turbinata]
VAELNNLRLDINLTFVSLDQRIEVKQLPVILRHLNIKTRQTYIEFPNMDSCKTPQAKSQRPCAACMILRRRCEESCLLAPYFSRHEVEKFVKVHKVFGASNAVKMIQVTIAFPSYNVSDLISITNSKGHDQMVEETHREDAVKALVYEATARLKDPVYGSAGTIFHLQMTIQELKMRLELTRAQILELQEKRDELLGVLSHYNQLNHVSSMHEIFHVSNVLHDHSLIYDLDEPSLNTNWNL